jgi:phosphoribosylamine-glycine ligase
MADACSAPRRWARTSLEARDHCYALVDTVDWAGMYCRRDIGWRAIERYSQANHQD